MKLNWLRAGCASIAESGGWSLVVYKYIASGGVEIAPWCCRVLSSGGGRRLDIDSYFATREAAEAACEQWLEDNDKPVWHDATDWLSWAEWRGRRIVVCPSSFDGLFTARCTGLTKYFGAAIATIADAKAAAEKYVRENT